MPAGQYIQTPATNDLSSFNIGLDRLNESSPEKSFVPPQQGRDLITQLKSARGNGTNLKTPRATMRAPLRLLPNGNQPKSEFTPLMKSATKNNMARRLSGRKVAPDTPAYLRIEHSLHGATPGQPKLDENSQLQSEHTGSSVGDHNDFTPIPHNISSSAQSTPLAQLPTREAGGVVNDGNVMTLREQENIIDKIEKENFGLKMKIHFLEEALSKRGSEFNKAALKENTDLKVNRITMQKELHKFKKNIAQAERDAETYRLQLEEYRQRIRQKHADESMRLEMAGLQTSLQTKETEIQQLRNKLETVKDSQDQEAVKLRDDVEDLQADLREKERLIGEKEDEIDAIKLKVSKESNISAEFQDEIETLQEQIEDLKQNLENAGANVEEAKEQREEAMDEKRKAEENLDELQDEMANKSFTTKGLSRQLEDKANKLEDDLNELQEKHAELAKNHEEKLQSERHLQDCLRELERSGTSEVRLSQQELDIAQQQRETAERKLATMSKQLETANNDLEIKSEEKDLLQSRHDALTIESAQLQRDLVKAQKTIGDLQSSLDEERQRAAQNELYLRSQAKQEADLLTKQIDSLHREVNAKDSESAAQYEDWESEKRTLQSASQRAEEKAVGLQRTVDKLQSSQGALSGKESHLQEALASEIERHQQEVKSLQKQIQDLNFSLAEKRTIADDNRNELNNAKEQLRISIREQAEFKEKVAELEEEIEVLQADIEEEHNLAQQLQKNGAHDVQFEKIQAEKQTLQDQLATLNVELHNAKRSARTAEAARESLEVKLHKFRNLADDTFNAGDSEKRELRRAKSKLEKDLERLKSERDNLQQVNQSLEEEVNAEIDRARTEEERLNSELDAVRFKQSSDSLARELRSAKSKIARLEARIVELDNQTKIIQSPHTDLSGLKADLITARDNEAVAVRREADLKSSNRKLNTAVHDLEKELHELRLAQFKSFSRSPSVSPGQAAKDVEELTSTRRELLSLRSEMRDVQHQNRELKRTAAKKTPEVDEAERADLHKLVKERVLEAETLRSDVRERDHKIDSLKSHIKSLRDSSRSNQAPQSKDRLRLTTAEEAQARETKAQLHRLREERSIANKKADTVEHELEILQSRYESMLEKLAAVADRRDGMEKIREKEMKGLIRETNWLRVNLRREQRLREAVGWAKSWVEREESMRVRW